METVLCGHTLEYRSEAQGNIFTGIPTSSELNGDLQEIFPPEPQKVNLLSLLAEIAQLGEH